MSPLSNSIQNGEWNCNVAGAQCATYNDTAAPHVRFIRWIFSNPDNVCNGWKHACSSLESRGRSQQLLGCTSALFTLGFEALHVLLALVCDLLENDAGPLICRCVGQSTALRHTCGYARDWVGFMSTIVGHRQATPLEPRTDSNEICGTRVPVRGI